MRLIISVGTHLNSFSTLIFSAERTLWLNTIVLLTTIVLVSCIFFASSSAIVRIKRVRSNLSLAKIILISVVIVIIIALAELLLSGQTGKQPNIQGICADKVGYNASTANNSTTSTADYQSAFGLCTSDYP